MSLSSRSLIVVLATLSFHSTQVFAQKESAPQEPPYTQEDSEFDKSPVKPAPKKTLKSQEDAELSSIEDEIRNADSPKGKPSTVDLNQSQPGMGNIPLEPENTPLNRPTNKAFSDDDMVIEEPAAIQKPKAKKPVGAATAQVVEEETNPEEPFKQSDVVKTSPKGGIEYIHHPQAAKGLIRIQKDGTYVYRTNEDTSFHQTGTFRMGTIDPPRITSADGVTTFDTMYSASPVPIVMFDYDWVPFTNYGLLGVQAGVGAMFAQGRGRFAAGPMVGQQAQEKYTFIAIPLSLGVTYRLEYLSRQWVAPYISGGGVYFGIAELRDDSKAPSVVGTPGAYGGGGLMFNVTAMSRETGFTLRNEYGISSLWITLEFRHVQTFSDDLDFTSNIITAGISVDY